MKSNILFEFNMDLQNLIIKTEDFNLKIKGQFGEIVMPPRNLVYFCEEIYFHLPSEHLLGKNNKNFKKDNNQKKIRWKKI